MAINANSAPAEKQHIDDLAATVVVGTHQVDGTEADRNVHPLKGVKSFVDCRLMTEVGNERRDGTFGHNRISIGGQGQLKERTVCSLDIKSGSQFVSRSQASWCRIRWRKEDEANDMLILVSGFATMFFDIWTVVVKCPSDKETTKALLGAVLP